MSLSDAVLVILLIVQYLSAIVAFIPAIFFGFSSPVIPFCSINSSKSCYSCAFRCLLSATLALILPRSPLTSFKCSSKSSLICSKQYAGSRNLSILCLLPTWNLNLLRIVLSPSPLLTAAVPLETWLNDFSNSCSMLLSCRISDRLVSLGC